MLLAAQHPELVFTARAGESCQGDGKRIQRLRHGLSYLSKKAPGVLCAIARGISRLDERKAFLGQSLEDFIASREWNLGAFAQLIAGKWPFGQQCVISLSFVLIQPDLLQLLYC